MVKKYLFPLLLLVVGTTYAQNYVDLLKVDYSNVINAGFEDADSETNVRFLDVKATVPIPINDKVAIITGADFLNQNLKLSPTDSDVSLSSLTFKAGLSIKHSEKWSGSYVFLPKVASEDLEFENDAFFIGGIALMKYQKSKNVQYRFGMYATQEAFGTLLTPILGLYYANPENHWEATLNLPINGDVNYSFNEVSKLGLAYSAPVRSYVNTPSTEGLETYTHSNIIEVGPYIEHSFAKQHILLKLQAGYNSLDYQVFGENDLLPIRVAFAEFGDDRNRLNSEMNGNFFLKIGATYRFHITDSAKETE